MKFFLQKKSFLKAFTLVELVVAITISSILFVFLFNFVVDALNEIGNSKNKTEFFADFSSFDIKLKNIAEIFPKYSLLIQKNAGDGSDIVLFKNRKENSGIAIGIVNVDNMKFDKNYDEYSEKVIGLIELTKEQLDELNSDPNKIYDYVIYKDKIFENIYVRDFQAILYNGDKILELSLVLMASYNPSYDGEKWENLNKQKLFKLVLDF